MEFKIKPFPITTVDTSEAEDCPSSHSDRMLQQAESEHDSSSNDITPHADWTSDIASDDKSSLDDGASLPALMLRDCDSITTTDSASDDELSLDDGASLPALMSHDCDSITTVDSASDEELSLNDGEVLPDLIPRDCDSITTVDSDSEEELFLDDDVSPLEFLSCEPPTSLAPIDGLIDEDLQFFNNFPLW